VSEETEKRKDQREGPPMYSEHPIDGLNSNRLAFVTELKRRYEAYRVGDLML
jgi:hypothetical protein